MDGTFIILAYILIGMFVLALGQMFVGFLKGLDKLDSYDAPLLRVLLGIMSLFWPVGLPISALIGLIWGVLTAIKPLYRFSENLGRRRRKN